MSQNKTKNTLYLISGVLLIFFTISCSNQKNTALTRFYHSVNTRYNIHFNANEAYQETLKSKISNSEDNLSELLYVFPDNSDSSSMQLPGQNFTTTIDKTTKAIKLHSIKAKPRRDPKRRNDAKYQAWLKQQEYTPFMDQVWLLLAKAEFQEANYLRSITTFMYITKIYSSNPDIVAECQLWISRAYAEMGWMYESGNMLHKMEITGGIPESQQGLYSAVKTNYLIRSNDYAAAIPFLEAAIKKEKDKHQKLRLKYLLGQVYMKAGDKQNADKAFSSVQGLNTPYKYTFNAKLQQIDLNSSQREQDVISSLSKMTKSSKNKDYLDQLYYKIGKVYLQYQDTIKATENLTKAIKESTRNGYDKTLAQITLGDLYFNQRKFVPAQPCYSEALSALKKSHPDYPKVALRSEVLDELVVHVKTVLEQDSLQHLAGLSETERLAIIEKKIEDIKKEEAKKAKEEERQKQQEVRQERITSWDQLESAQSSPETQVNVFPQPGSAIQSNTGNDFYFYSPQTVTQGKVAFQKQWGNRKLEDDWRRRNKIGFSSNLADLTDEPNENDSIEVKNKEIVAQEGIDGNEKNDSSINKDIYSVEYYLQQLPLTADKIAESNVLIENALFNMGKIYKDKLEDMNLAIDAFNTDIKRFPQTPNLQEIYYQLLLIYMQQGNEGMLSYYRNKILAEFPQGQYATPLSDPDFEWNFRHMPLLQDSLYTEAYEAYTKTDVKTVRRNYEAMKEKYPFTDLMPKFTLLNALTYAQTRDIKALGENLSDLTSKYPKADVTPLATDILNRIKEGRVLLSDGTPVTGFDWSKAYSGNTAVGGDSIQLAFSDSLNTEYMLLLMYKSNTIDRNELLYQVADYNFSNYVIQTFDLSFTTEPPFDILQIKGFKSFSNIKSYINKSFTTSGLMQQIDTTILALPISIKNYTDVLPKLGLENYISFFTEVYQKDLPSLIAYWQDKEKARKDFFNEEESSEQTDVDQADVTTNEPEKEIIQIENKEAKVESEKEQPKEDKTPERKDRPINDKEINADDLLSKDQLEKAGEINNVIESVEDIVNNPVDGIKNLFKNYNNKPKLTKEEKETLKEEKKLEKLRLKEEKAKEKAKADSIQKVEKAVQDSIDAINKAKEKQIELENKRIEEETKAAIKAKAEEKSRLEQERKDRLKEREAERKEKERLRKERLREREQERKEKEKAREQERKEKGKQAEEKRKEQLRNS